MEGKVGVVKGGDSKTSLAAIPGTINTGSGGGGNSSSMVNPFVNGGSGIIIIRDRSIPTAGTPLIELIRGISGDSYVDYKIANYNGDFKIISSVSGVDTDYIKISGSSITNPNGTTSWTSASDRRVKENIERASYDICYENISKLELNRFSYIQGFNNVNKDIKQLGFIAQEVNEIFPKAVFSNEYINGNMNIPDMLSIDISQINYTLYGAVKKLMDINKSHDDRIKELEKKSQDERIKELEIKIEKLMNYISI